MNELSLYRCLASPTRLEALRLLAEGETSVGELASAARVEQTNLSHQLRELRECGLVATRQDGKRVMYRLAHPGIARLLDAGKELAIHIDCADGATCPPGC